ncbi:hypothetical protein [Colwellia sp. 12G3]|uniref:hypothetical protein n=1 Tax=Colwellia sp. 12G3 TaxID=2058299 RepID=UPI000C32A27B|nr:hypothetical protein [Colwellia sp. 12G3]PKI15867.1 hypothetical protein CXF71_12760 [Colwellia sp. 12G3]
MNLNSIDYDQSKKWLDSPLKKALIKLITSSFNDVDAELYFSKYFDANDVFSRKLRIYYYQKEVVGYCLITFTKSEQEILIRASAAFYPQYRKGGNTFIFSMTQAFLYWLKNPLKNIYYADTMLSPAMYRAIANKAAIVWPSEKLAKQPKQLFEQFNGSGDLSSLLNLRCLLNVGRSSNYSESEVNSFKASEKSEINYYCQINPNFDKGIALFVIMPINFKQFILTALKLSPFSSVKEKLK